MSENKNQQELSKDELEQASGGNAHLRKSGRKRFQCHHPNKVRTGNEKEDDFFIFWSRHKYEYTCPDCGSTIWETT